MDKRTQPQQLSLSFDLSPLHSALSEAQLSSVVPTYETVHSTNLETMSQSMPHAAKVIDFRFEASKREALKQASLYRQILDSVRHIG